MKKERCEELKTDVEIKEIAKRKSNITTFIFSICILFIGILGFIYVIAKAESIIPLLIAILLITTLIFIMRRFLLPMAFEDSEQMKRSEMYVEKYLSSNEYIEVQPIKIEEIDDMEVMKHYNLYARVKDDIVIIIMKPKDKEEYFEYKRIFKDCFYNYYRVKKEK